MRSGHTVVVRGYLGEPFLRITETGVAVNEASPTAAGVGLLQRGRPRAATSPSWLLRSRARTEVWHDARLRGLPHGVDRGRWTVPLVVDGRPVQLLGELWRAHRPPLWPWVALGAPFIALAALLLLSRRPPAIRAGAAGLGVAAAAGTIATAAGFALDPNASGGRWVEGGNELVFALVGLAVVARGSPDSQAVAGGALGLLGLAVGLSKVPVLLHGVVLSALPDTAARLAVVLTIWAGVAATTVGGAVFSAVLDRPGEIV